ncbi:MAG: helix-turn-helix transcriptional regulator [Henriciella sp.]
MTKEDSNNHLRAWRELRELTQDGLAQEVGTTAAVISLLENGQRSLSESWLRRLAPVLQTTPGFLLDHHPSDLTTEMLSLWSNIPKKRQSKAIAALKALSGQRRGG